MLTVGSWERGSDVQALNRHYEGGVTRLRGGAGGSVWPVQPNGALEHPNACSPSEANARSGVKGKNEQMF